MIKETVTSTAFISVEKKGKIVELYFEKECLSLDALYRKYGKENVTVQELQTKRYISILTDKNSVRRRTQRTDDNCRVHQQR